MTLALLSFVAGLLARLDWTVVCGGINDNTSGVAPATTLSNIDAIYSAIKAAGSEIVLCTLA